MPWEIVVQASPFVYLRYGVKVYLPSRDRCDVQTEIMKHKSNDENKNNTENIDKSKEKIIMMK